MSVTSELRSAKRALKTQTPPPPAPEGSCNFYIRKKNRYCKMVPAKDLRFCGEHIMNETNQDLPAKKIRIPCPIDDSHTCFQTQLEKHLRICNARLVDQPAGFVRNFNAGPTNLEIPQKISINDLSPPELKDFIEKVKSASESFCLDAEKIECLIHPVMKEELSRTDLSEDGALKHGKQQASILGHMSSHGLLRDGFCYLEMGAGRGHMNHWLQKALGNETSSRFVLVDRQGVRYKMDAHHRDEEEGPKFHRLRMDIEHFCLSQVPEIKKDDFPVVIVSKHLCGAATDLTLRCAFPDDTSDSTGSLDSATLDGTRIEKSDASNHDVKSTLNSLKPAAISPVTGIVIALCCHHRVEYRSYVGHVFLKSLGFTPRDFWLLRSLSSWATCGFDQKKKAGKEKETEDIETVAGEPKEEDQLTDEHRNGDVETLAEEKPKNPEWDWYYEMSIEDRTQIGRRCKRLLDQGRIAYIRGKRPDDEISLIPFVEQSTSLENVLLMSLGK